jgi:heat shock protein HslJ
MPVKNKQSSCEERKVDMKTTIILIMVTLVGLTLTACSSSAAGQALTESLWLLTELNGQSPIPETSINAQFDEDGRVSGSSGCNTYSTTYNVSGEQLTFGEEIITTLLVCQEPVMEQENEYLQVLRDTATFQIEESNLTLYDVGDKELARFAEISQSLGDTSWTVHSYNTGTQAVTTLISGTEITANFSEDGQLSGNASCNQYTTTYETEDDTITIGPTAVTERFCAEPQGIMKQEQRYLAALQTADTYKVTGLDMEIRTQDGALVASFKRVLNQ